MNKFKIIFLSFFCMGNVMLQASWLSSCKAYYATQKKDYKSAREILERDLVDRPNDPYLNYNLGNLYYKQKDFVLAQESFTRALQASGATEKSFIEKTNFNVGNCYYQNSLVVLGAGWEKKLLDQKIIEEAIKLLQGAIKHFHQALALNPDNPRTKTNKKIAEELLKKLQEKQQQQEKNDQQKEGQNKDQKKEPEDKQQQRQQQDRQNQDKQNQKSEEPKDDEQKKQEEQKSEEQKQAEQKHQESAQQEKQQSASYSDGVEEHKQESMEKRSVRALLDQLQANEKNLQKQLLLQKTKQDEQPKNKYQKPW